MFFVFFLALCAQFCDPTLAESIPVATSTIVSTVTSLSFSVTSSVASISSTTNYFDSCSTTTDDNGEPSSYCLGGAAISTVDVYATETFTFTDVYTTTLGFSTIYSDVAGATPIPTSDASLTSVSSIQAEIATSTSLQVYTSDSKIATSTLLVGQTKASSSASTTSTSSTPSTENKSQSSASSESKSGTSTGLKVALAIVAIVCCGLAAGIIFFMVKKRRNKNAKQLAETDEFTNTDIEKPELQGSTGAPGSVVATGKAELYSGSLHTAPNRYGGNGPHEIYQEQKTFHEAHGTQRYEMAGTITSVHELDSGPPGYQYHAR